MLAGMFSGRASSGPPPGGTLYDEIMADSPVHYWRNGEASGSVMADEVSTDGSYIGSPSLGNAAIYPGAGAPTCATGFAPFSDYGQSSVDPPSLAAMTLVAVVQFNSIGGFQPVGASRDLSSSGRMFQWRSNGAAMEFIKIVSGVSSASTAGVFVAGVTCIVSFEVDSSGNWTMYKDGASIGTGSIPAADYGGAGDDWQIGFVTGMGAAMDGYVCENAVFDYVIGPTRQAAYAAAAGL